MAGHRPETQENGPDMPARRDRHTGGAGRSEGSRQLDAQRPFMSPPGRGGLIVSNVLSKIRTEGII